MYELFLTSTFKSDFKKHKNNFKFIKEFNIVAKQLVLSGTVDKKYRPHKLFGNYKNSFECHIFSDFLLIWQKDETLIKLIRIGTHSELF